jgi:hypothetical protein
VSVASAEDLDPAMRYGISLKGLPGGLPFPGAVRGRAMNETEEISFVTAKELPSEKKLDKLLSVQRKFF